MLYVELYLCLVCIDCMVESLSLDLSFVMIKSNFVYIFNALGAPKRSLKKIRLFRGSR